jgi:hypothetical protein
MDDVCSFVDDIRLMPNKLQRLTDIIADILKQTVECAIFIREYTGHGFAGMCLSVHGSALAPTSSTARVVKQTFSNTGQTIKDLSNHLIALKQSFDSGIALQTVFVSTRTQEEVEKLGMECASVHRSLGTQARNVVSQDREFEASEPCSDECFIAS